MFVDSRRTTVMEKPRTLSASWLAHLISASCLTALNTTSWLMADTRYVSAGVAPSTPHVIPPVMSLHPHSLHHPPPSRTEFSKGIAPHPPTSLKCAVIDPIHLCYWLVNESDELWPCSTLQQWSLCRLLHFCFICQSLSQQSVLSIFNSIWRSSMWALLSPSSRIWALKSVGFICINDG